MAGTVSNQPAWFVGAASNSDCEATTDWTTSSTITADTEFYVQGSASLSAKCSKAGGLHTFNYATNANTDVTGKNIYFWVCFLTPKILTTKSGGGIRLYIADGAGNNGSWYVDGSDTYPGGWVCYCVNTATAYSTKSATAPTLTQIRTVGIHIYTTGTTSKTNLFYDAVRFGTGLTIEGGTSGSPATWADLVADENTNKYGVILPYLGAYLCQGEIKFGSTVNATATYFKDTTGPVMLFRQNPVYTATGGVLLDNAATPAPLASLNKITLQGNGGANTEVYWGDKASGTGYGGCVIANQNDNYRCSITASDTNVTKFSFSGCTFQDCGITTGQAYNANKDFTSCTFTRCREVKAANGIVTKCVFASAPGPALLITSTTHYTSYCSFVSCFAALHLTTTTGTYSITGSAFINNTYDVLNATAGAITLNCVSCSPAATTELTVLTTNNKAQSYNNTGTAYTDESTAAFNDSPYDMNLLAQANEASDAYLFGNTASQFTAIGIYVVIPGSGNWVVSTTTGWEYSTGAGTWSALSGVSATSLANFMPTVKGTYMVTFTAPGGGWVTATYNTITAYWIRAKITTYTSVTYPPKGTEAWLATTSNSTLQQTVSLVVTCKTDAGYAIEGARVRIEKASDGTLISNGTTNSSGVYTDSTYNYSIDVNVNVIARLKGYIPYNGSSTIASTGLNVPATMPIDEAINLP